MKKPASSKPKYREPKILWKKPDFMEERFIDRVKKDNTKLGKMVSDLRQKPTNEATAKKDFYWTYLRHPLLKRPGRKTSTRWKDVLKELKIIVAKHNLSAIQSEITLEYVPRKNKTPNDDKDLKAHVRTTLSFQSDGIDVMMEGDLFHRRPCPIDP